MESLIFALSLVSDSIKTSRTQWCSSQFHCSTMRGACSIQSVRVLPLQLSGRRGKKSTKGREHSHSELPRTTLYLLFKNAFCSIKPKLELVAQERAGQTMLFFYFPFCTRAMFLHFLPSLSRDTGPAQGARSCKPVRLVCNALPASMRQYVHRQERRAWGKYYAGSQAVEAVLRKVSSAFPMFVKDVSLSSKDREFESALPPAEFALNLCTSCRRYEIRVL